MEPKSHTDNFLTADNNLFPLDGSGLTLGYAPAWKRILAYLVDTFLTNIVTVTVMLTVGIPDEMENWMTLAIFMSYSILAEFKFQATIGKRLMRLVVVRSNGQRPTLKTAFYRNFGKVVSVLPLYWGFVRLLTPSYRQGIHDELARCFVMEKRKS